MGYECHLFGAQRSYNSLSIGSKQVTRDGSARIVTLCPGVPKLDDVVMGKVARKTERERLDNVVEVGEASPGTGVAYVTLSASQA